MGNSLLHIAILYNRTKIVQILLNMGANINIKNFHGDTPFMCSQNNIKIFKIGLLFNFDVNIQNKYGLSIFHQILHFYNVDYEIIEILIQRGINPWLKTNYGETVFDILKRLNKQNIADFIHFCFIQKEIWSSWELE